jgi:CHC2 zinc finger/RepB DNA-primase N-terminal domain
MTATAPSKQATGVEALDRYLRLLAGPAPRARLLEIRFALRHRDMGRLFIAANSAPGASRLIRRLAVRTDVYVGVCLRSRRSGGRDAIEDSHLAFVEIDAPDALDRLHAFPHPPTMIVSSGSAGHAHAYFALSAPVPVPKLEQANRRLAHALGGDLACVDCARILRPPTSWNHKHTPPAPVELVELDRARRYDLEQLVDGLEDPPGRPHATAAPGRRTQRTELDRLLLAIPAAEYVRTLVGVRPDRTGKIHCPFHGDRTPSLQLYDDGTWYCYGACRAGGSIFDFAARTWRMDTNGRAFLKLRARLADDLGLTGRR